MWVVRHATQLLPTWSLSSSDSIGVTRPRRARRALAGPAGRGRRQLADLAIAVGEFLAVPTDHRGHAPRVQGCRGVAMPAVEMDPLPITLNLDDTHRRAPFFFTRS